jgi:hypothetical protein
MLWPVVMLHTWFTGRATPKLFLAPVVIVAVKVLSPMRWVAGQKVAVELA